MDTLLLQTVTDYYLHSPDYNGILLSDLSPCDMEAIKRLIQNKKVFVLSENDTINIFINAYNKVGSIDEQISALFSGKMIAIYPTQEHLMSLQCAETRPFSRMLALGVEQLRILYFSVDILDMYMNNPQYLLMNYGYRGRICVKDEFLSESDPIHSEYIKDYGIAYPATGPIDGDRAIGVFVRDLASLSEEAQYKWRGFLLPDQKQFLINDGFIKNLVYGSWVTTTWVFDAVLEEIRLINKYARNMGLPPVFRKEHSREDASMNGYGILLIPSLKNYYDFVSIIEKIAINNLNVRTFQTDTRVIRSVERRKDDGTLKGSIEMLEEWIPLNHSFYDKQGRDSFNKDVILVFRKIRKLRQVPAHELYSNQHDKNLYRKQNELVKELYHALLILRLILGTYPTNKRINIPDMLQNYDQIVVY